VQACWALRELGYETIMINCNPETVSTDYDTADRLYFEPLTLEDVLNVLELEQPEGVIVQFGGQTPINLTRGWRQPVCPSGARRPIRLTWPKTAAALATCCNRWRLTIPPGGWPIRAMKRWRLAAHWLSGVGTAVFRPRGRAMAIAYSDDELFRFLKEAAQVSPGNPVLIDQFIEDAFEVDVDAISDGENVVMAGVMQHIEEAGVHSGDSACVLPPYKISLYHLSIISDYSEKLGQALKVKGLMNIQFAIKDDVVYVIEVNPRASRTVPFVSKATGVPIAALPPWCRRARRCRSWGLDPNAGRRRLFCQRGGSAFQQAAGSRYPAQAGDAQHGRGDGPRGPIWPRLCQSRSWRWARRCRRTARC
jgi:carbamoyl-phosphate synthase large subunit